MQNSAIRFLSIKSLFVAFVLAISTRDLSAADWKFTLKIAPQIRQQPFTGRVYVFFQKGTKSEPRTGMDWFHPIPFIALDVNQWQPAEPLLISAATPKLLSFPQPLGDLQLAGFRAQAIVRLNPFEREVGEGAGNGISNPVPLVDNQDTRPIEFTIEKLIPEPVFPKRDHCRELIVRSDLLSRFHGRDVSLKAAVHLPASYSTFPARRYPVIFMIPGFGGTHFDGAGDAPVKETNQEGVEFIRVNLDPSCPLGHHVFADSANNGPVGQALVQEFLPALDKAYRTVAAPTARFLTGHSSGGWSSLWVQITHPESFGGTWSTSPDPVDFRDFQTVNLYQPSANLYRDNVGLRRPLGRHGTQVLLWADDFCDMETGLGDGGQLRSFEAVFSPRGPDRQPRILWDRRTGAIDQSVAADWKQYDIRLKLVAEWQTLGPKLAGKLHVFMGSQDTFYLEPATHRLKEALKDLGSDAVIEILPGKDHFNLFAGGLDLRIRQEMTAAFLKYHKP
ncbi:MAG: putative esterase [Planctomycetaceae bacterium]|nr:putative esterase [Planctomycetaceae bacterium]